MGTSSKSLCPIVAAISRVIQAWYYPGIVHGDPALKLVIYTPA
jgi:hypothetical protein